MNSSLIGFSKVVLFLLLLPVIFIGAVIGFEEWDSAVDSLKNSDIYYKEVGYTGFNEIDLEEFNWNGLEMHFAGDREIDISNLMLGEGTNFSYASSVNSHGLEKHGAKALLVISCINKSGGILQIENPDDGRIAIICTIETSDPEWEKYNGKFGVGIFEENSATVTAFIKEKIKNMTGLFRYLYNRGYTINNPYIP